MITLDLMEQLKTVRRLTPTLLGSTLMRYVTPEQQFQRAIATLTRRYGAKVLLPLIRAAPDRETLLRHFGDTARDPAATARLVNDAFDAHWPLVIRAASERLLLPSALHPMLLEPGAAAFAQGDYAGTLCTACQAVETRLQEQAH